MGGPLWRRCRPPSRPNGIVIDAKDRPWFNLFGANRLGTIDPATLRLREYTLPDERARGRRITMTADGRLWFVGTGLKPNRLVGFDPRRETFFGITPVGSADAPNTVRHMVFDKTTQSIWFGSDQGTIGRAVVPKGNPKPVA
jgi:virginiamycin B lyase